MSMRFPTPAIRYFRFVTGQLSRAMLLCILLAVACEKEKQPTSSNTNQPAPGPDSTINPGTGQVTIFDFPIQEWKFYPYSGPEWGDDSMFFSKIPLAGPDFARIGRVNAVYLSEPSGSRFAVKAGSSIMDSWVYAYSISGPGENDASSLDIWYTQKIPGNRPLADSVHLELIR
jgi:hypothetical protein